MIGGVKIGRTEKVGVDIGVGSVVGSIGGAVDRRKISAIVWRASVWEPVRGDSSDAAGSVSTAMRSVAALWILSFALAVGSLTCCGNQDKVSVMRSRRVSVIQTRWQR